MKTPQEYLQIVIERSQNHAKPERANQLEKLIEAIKEPLIKAPASTSKSKHDAHEGGLLSHILQVHNHLLNLAKPYSDIPQGKILTSETMWSVSLLHDLRKVCDAEGNPYYVDNILQSGKLSKEKPFKTNHDYLKLEEAKISKEEIPRNMAQSSIILQGLRQIPDGICSLSLIQLKAPELFLQLSQEEKNAILWHDGGYGPAKYEANGKENILSILLHTADMLASRWEKFDPNPEAA